MRHTQSQSQYRSSWSHYAKAAAVFTLITATYLVARTTGWLPGWFSNEKSSDDTDKSSALTTSSAETSLIPVMTVESKHDFQLQSTDLTDLQTAELVDLSIIEEDIEQPQILSTQRRLLQQPSQVTVINPILDQAIEINQPYSYSLNHIFSDDYAILEAVETGKTSLPSWLSLQYQLVGSYPAYRVGYVQRVAVSGSAVFVADYNAGLLVLDVSTPSVPRLVGSYPASASGVAVSGNTVFLAVGTAGLLILNVSIPSAPRLLGSYPAGSGRTSGVEVSDGIVFVANYNALLILNVSVPSAPHVLGNYFVGSSGHVSGVAVSGNTAFVVDGTAGLLILNVSTLSTPRLLGSYPAGSGQVYDVAVSGSIVFVADYTAGLLILDMSMPSAPRLLGSYSVAGGYAWGVAVSGSTVFVADYTAGLLILDVSTPSTPRLLSSYPGSGFVFDVEVSGSTVFVVDYNGLLILDVSKGQLIGAPPNNPGQQVVVTVSVSNFSMVLADTTFVLTLDHLPSLPGITVSDQTLFPGYPLSLPLSSHLFRNPGNSFLHLSLQLNGSRSVPAWLMLAVVPVAVGSYPAGLGSALNMAISGSTMFVADSATLQILDMSISSTPRLLNSYSVGTGVVLGVAVFGSTVFVANDNALLILDVGTPSTPRLLSSYSVSLGAASDVAVSGSTVYVAVGSAGLLILDVSTPSTPRLLSSYSAGLGHAYSVTVSGSTVYMADGSAGLVILNVSTPSAPRLLGSYPAGSGITLAVVVSGSIMFVANYNALLILNISTPSTPLLLGSYSAGLRGDTQAVAVSGSTLFVANGNAVLILDVSMPSAPHLLGSYPAGLGFAEGIAVSDNTVFVADWSAGLLILDVSQWTLMATPTMTDVGNYDLELIATDDLGGTASIPFTIRVEGPPQLNGSIPLQRAWVGQPFNYFVLPDLFFDPNDDVIDYNTDLMGGKKLPGWLRFNPRTIGFGGVAQAGDAGNYTIVLSATDHICPEIPTVNFTVSVGFLPVLSHRISNQLAPIGLPYRFAMPKNSFYDPDGLTLSYLAQGINNQPLPSWLQFNSTSLMFSGVANTSSITVYTLQLIATNSAGGQVIAAFTLRTDHFPVLNKTLSLPIAVVNQPWVWTLPRDAFTDADGDPLTYAATQVDGSVLPSWLSFNPITRVFTGAPLLEGVQGLKLTAQDIYGGSDSTYLNITILPASQAGLVISSPRARVGKSFVFQVPPNNFSSSGTFNYSVALTDGASLPSWLRFITSNLSFIGLPNISDVGSYDVTLTATDTQGDHFNVSFVLNVNPNYPPQVRLPISNQVAQVGEAFVFYASLKTFMDLNGDNLTYTVNPLPSWLLFDPSQLKFSGTPSRRDTDPLSARRVNVELTAHDDQSQTSTLFTISVKGTSSLMLFLQVGIPLLSGLASLYEAYQNRALVLNRCCKKRIVKSETVAITGEEFHYDFKTQPEQVGKIQVRLPKLEETKFTTNCCVRLFRPCKEILEESPKHLPADYPLPTWLDYKADGNRLFSKKRVPPVNHPQFTVQVLNSAGVIREEVNVTVQGMRV